MRITEQRQGAVTVLKPEGPLVGADAEQVREHVGGLVARTMGRLVLDMSGVAYVDSAGLEALVALTEDMGASGHALKLCATNKTVREAMELTDLANQFDHFDEVGNAVRSFL